MPMHTIKAPDKRHYQVNVPEWATESQAIDYFKTRWKAGSVDPKSAVKQGGGDEGNALREFLYGFDSSSTDIDNASLWLQSQYPHGKMVPQGEGFYYQTPDEMYGEGFEQLPPERRREHLLKLKQKRLQDTYPDVVEEAEQRGENTGWTTAGNMTGTVTTPSTLAFPSVSSYKGLAMVGGLLASEHSALRQLAEDGSVSPTEVLKEGSMGAAFSLGGGLLLRGVATGAGKIAQKRADKAAMRQSEKLIDEVNEELAIAVNSQTPTGKLQEAVEKTTGITAKDIQEAIPVAGRKPVIPSPKEARIVVDAIRAKNAAGESGMVGTFLDDYLGNVSTRVANISKPVFGRLREFEFNTKVNTHKYLKRVDPFLVKMDNMPEKTQRVLARSLANGDFKDAKAIINHHDPSMVDDFKEVPTVLRDVFKKLKHAGYQDLKEVYNYYPRFVSNVDSLLSKLGHTDRNLIDKALLVKAKQLKVKDISDIPFDDRTDVVNKVLRGYLPKLNEGQLSFTRARSVTRVTEDMLDDYASPAEALHTYLLRSVSDIERRKFFGRGATTKEGHKLDLDKSIGRIVHTELATGRISNKGADELKTLLQARFGPGEQSPHTIIQAIRNIGHATTIANPYSAATQIGDIGVAAYVNGLDNTMSAMLSKKAVNLEDFGLGDIIAEEFATTGATAKALHKLFTISQFRRVDKFSKNVFLNGALKKATLMSKHPKGITQLREKYGRVFGNEFKHLTDDLANGKITDNVKLYLWNELSDVQPISLSEMPLKYLEAPNGRLHYSLKTWALKQLDLLRRDVGQQWARGNRKEAVRNAVRYSVLAGSTQATVDEVRDLMSRDEFSVEDLPENFTENLFKTFGASEYVRDKYVDGKVMSGLTELMLPPLDWIDAIGTDIIAIAKGEKDTPDEILRQLPIGGRFWYMWFGGGIEKKQERDWEKEHSE